MIINNKKLQYIMYLLLFITATTYNYCGHHGSGGGGGHGHQGGGSHHGGGRGGHYRGGRGGGWWSSPDYELLPPLVYDYEDYM